MKKILLIIFLCTAYSTFAQVNVIQNVIEQRLFEENQLVTLLNKNEDNFDFAIHQLNYSRESGDMKRVFDGQVEHQYNFSSSGRRQINESLTLQGNFQFLRHEWIDHQFHLNPGFDTYEYLPYFNGAKQPIESSEDIYFFDGLVAYDFGGVGLQLGGEYQISNLFGQTDPSGDVQETIYEPKLGFSFAGKYQINASFRKEKQEGRFNTKNEEFGNSSDDSVPLARFFYTGYGTRIIASLPRLDANKDEFSIGASTKQMLAGGQLFIHGQASFGDTEFFRFESDDARDKLVYGEYTSNDYQAALFYTKPLNTRWSSILDYKTIYKKSNDINRGIEGNQSLELYNGNDYFHDLSVGVTQTKQNPFATLLHFNYGDISRVETGKIAFVNKHLKPMLSFEKQWDQVQQAEVNFSLLGEMGYNYNLESEMIITGDAGSNSPFFIQNIAIPEALFYRNNFIEAGIIAKMEREFPNYNLAITIDGQVQAAQGAELYEGYISSPVVDGNRMNFNFGIQVTH